MGRFKVSMVLICQVEEYHNDSSGGRSTPDGPHGKWGLVDYNCITT